MKKLQLILLIAGIVFLTVLVANVGVGELWHELALLGWGLIPLMLGEGVAEMIHTLGWRCCLSGPLRSLSWLALFRIRMAGYAINYLTPTAALGGEVTKGALLASHHRGPEANSGTGVSPVCFKNDEEETHGRDARATTAAIDGEVTKGILLASHHRGPEAASGVLIGKLCFALGHLIFVVLGAVLVLWRVKLPGTLWTAMLVCGALLAGGMITFLLLQKYGRLGGVVRWLAARKFAGQRLHKAARELTAVDETMKCFYKERPWGLPLAICWHLAGYSVGIVQTWLFFHLLHQNASWTVAASVWFLGMWFDLLTFAVPQNLGTLEGTRAVVLQAFGYTAVMGVTYGLALRLAQIFWSCFGLANYAWLVSVAKNAHVLRGGAGSLLQTGQTRPAIPAQARAWEQLTTAKREEM